MEVQPGALCPGTVPAGEEVEGGEKLIVSFQVPLNSQSLNPGELFCLSFLFYYSFFTS
jgi:hypothetical protein